MSIVIFCVPFFEDVKGLFQDFVLKCCIAGIYIFIGVPIFGEAGLALGGSNVVCLTFKLDLDPGA